MCIISRVLRFELRLKGVVCRPCRKEAIIRVPRNGTVMQRLSQTRCICACRYVSPFFILIHGYRRQSAPHAGVDVNFRRLAVKFFHGFIRNGRCRIAVVVFLVFIPVQRPVGTGRKEVVVDTRLGHVFTVRIEVLVIVPRVNALEPLFRCVLEACPVGPFIRITCTVGQ